MRIVFHYVEYKNFLSVGKVPLRVDLDKHATNLIYGANGSGKSTVYEALYFGLYGKAFREANKGDLVNWLNKRAMTVTVSFSVGTDQYLVTRGTKPEIFTIEKNGTSLDQPASVRDFQIYFEDNILKISSTTFLQTVVLGSTLYTPFMKLKLSDRRAVIEEMFDLQIFGAMNRQAKLDVNVLRSEGKQTINDHRLLTTSIGHIKEYIDQFEITRQKQVDDTNHALQRAREKEDQILVMLEQAQAQYDALVNDVDRETLLSWQDARRQCRETITRIQTEEQYLNDDIGFFSENSVCPQCKQNVETGHSELHLAELQTKKKELAKEQQSVRAQYEDLTKRIEHIEKTKQEATTIRSKIDMHKAELRHIKDHLHQTENTLQQLNNTDDLDQKKKELQDKELQQKSLHVEVLKKFTELKEYEIILDLLKDDGVKKKIIKTFLPIFNKLVSKYLQILGFGIKFTFDEQFKEQIIYRGQKGLKYGSFSEGERSRIDLALLFAFREFAELRTKSGCNLLIFDEIGDSTLDLDGADAFLTIVEAIASKANVFLISHRGDLLTGKFAATMRFYQKQYFSKMDVE